MLATIDCVVCPPGDQRYAVGTPPLGFAVSVTLPPGQNEVEPDALIVGTGADVTVTVVGDEVPVQLFASVTVTL